ncbi:uncharacterized protein J7T54_002032 [Emericellopsis cladophorae]|uniref:Uncharacterized protein n=1 Tax=Emericellopsis cladophorae TaxID=2686198 RepID=A0A9P9Y4C2_9HYPO|nr:uncharacterized protein J7T54_002032 [Emericellopsis cladophorae]KAI6782873.1 hypothetical protein J7T54_002032 [Emericellopsis cladophorae]
MDDPNQPRRHNDPHGQHTANPRFTSQPNRSISATTADRYRSAPLNASPQTPRSIGSAGNYSSYYPEPTSAFSSTHLNSASLAGYGSEYSHDGRQQQTQQSFGGYPGAAMMYNVAQPNAQTPVYDTQQFGARQPAGLQMMTPDVASTYFGGAATGNPASHSASLQQPGQHSGSSTALYQPGQALKYANDMSSVNAPAQQPQQPAQEVADASMGEQPEFSEGALQEKWHNYQRQLATVFQDISSGSLETAAETLLSISNWLLSQVAELGLTTDDANLHSDRIKLWDDFNHAWLALGQKQFDLMQDTQQMSRPARLLSYDSIENIGDEIVRLCNDLERHGLVDYQYGVWEEQITEIMMACLDLYDNRTQDSGA